ncbi:MAG: hypothetical protein HYW24_00835 [Candidatus Aenigmarchaeota archaeon]|nr:hypothetical protein [Candidatus Aenigmarchaeota archaeon]
MSKDEDKGFITFDFIQYPFNAGRKKSIKNKDKKKEANIRKQIELLVRAFDKNGNELNMKELGFKSAFNSSETANKFIDFCKQFHSRYQFKIEEMA